MPPSLKRRRLAHAASSPPAAAAGGRGRPRAPPPPPRPLRTPRTRPLPPAGAPRIRHDAGTRGKLEKLSCEEIAALALGWLDDPTARPERRPKPSAEDGDADDDDDEDDEDDEDEGRAPPGENEREGPGDLADAYTAPEGWSRSGLAARLLRDWSGGFTEDQLADLDVACFVKKPSKWTAYELQFAAGGGAVKERTEAAWKACLEAALGPFYAGCHVRVCRPYAPLAARSAAHGPEREAHGARGGPPDPTLHFRVSLSRTASTAAPAVIHFLHFPATPYLLLPPLSASHASTFRQSLCAAFTRPPGRAHPAAPGGVVEDLRALQYAGRDWRALRERLVESKASGGYWKQFRAARAQDGSLKVAREDGEALAPPEKRAAAGGDGAPDYVPAHERDRITMHDSYRKRARDQEVSAIFGRSELPASERVEWAIPFSYLVPDAAPLTTGQAISSPPGEADPAAGEEDDTFVIRIEGPSVFAGMRSLVELGFADRGLPEWMHEAATGGGENVVRLEQVEANREDAS